MAPLNLPPPALTLDEAVALEKVLVADKHFVHHDFLGSTLVDFISTLPEFKDSSSTLGVAGKDPVAIGEALLEHRLMHEVADEDGFSLHKRYRLISQETREVQVLHQRQSELINSALVTGKVQWKVSHFFGFFHSFVPVFAVLTNDKLTLLKCRSAVTAPLAEFNVTDLIEVEECNDCKADWYCFNIKTKKDTVVTLCADHSKRMEGWITVLGSLNVAFVKNKEDADDILKDINSLFELSARRLDSKEVVPLSQYKGKVCLVVNVSSLCGLTPQYAELETLYEKYKDQGLCILGFPVNQFANQEPGTEHEIAAFAHDKYHVTFDLFEKTKCNGSHTHPVFRFVKSHLNGFLGSSVKWNFTKFLCDRNGVPIKRFAPTTKPLSFEDDIVEALQISS